MRSNLLTCRKLLTFYQRRKISSNSGSIENRLKHFFCFEKFAGKVGGSSRMFRVIAINLFHGFNYFPQISKRKDPCVSARNFRETTFLGANPPLSLLIKS